MAALEFKFSSDQQHQLEAIEATCDLFRGQQFASSVFSADSGRKGQTAIGELMVGHGNELRVAPGQLLDNLHAVQEEGCLPATDVLTDGRLRDFTVEMETGTGKTYVYIRSIYELNRRYGITKFVIVVPSVAIREGVLKSFQTTRKHFETLYDRTPCLLRRFCYAVPRAAATPFRGWLIRADAATVRPTRGARAPLLA